MPSVRRVRYPSYTCKGIPCQRNSTFSAPKTSTGLISSATINWKNSSHSKESKYIYPLLSLPPTAISLAAGLAFESYLHTSGQPISLEQMYNDSFKLFYAISRCSNGNYNMNKYIINKFGILYHLDSQENRDCEGALCLGQKFAPSCRRYLLKLTELLRSKGVSLHGK